ncbi:MAG: hypothetical protein P8J87_06520, partial [Verrucomicrobiales bacterium]|nr:hypothetical protein [Verrucomicrobiales bacterium]
MFFPREIELGLLTAWVVGSGGVCLAGEGEEWWSWRALERPEVAEVAGNVGVVDAFVLAELGERGLE